MNSTYTPAESAAVELQRHAIKVAEARYRGPLFDRPAGVAPAPLAPADYPAVDAEAVEAANAGTYNAIAEIVFG